MKDYFNSVKASVESGEYYADALDWYQHRFIYPVIERAYLTLGLVLLGAVGFLVSAVYEVIQPLHKEVQFVAPLEDQTQFYTHLRDVPITTEGEASRVQAEQAIMKAIVAEFVRAYEEYDYRNEFAQLRANNTLIEKYADKPVAQAFAERISMANPASVIFQLRRDTRVTIVSNVDAMNITPLPETDVPEQGDTPVLKHYTMQVPFSAVYQGAGARTVPMTAELDVAFSGIQYDREKGDYLPFTLTVTKYTSKVIAQP